MNKSNHYPNFTDAESESPVVTKKKKKPAHGQTENKYLEPYLNPRCPASEFVLLITTLVFNLKPCEMFTQ